MNSVSRPSFNPFPGLRPFRESETHLFFGRSGQIDELLAQLERSRFVAVMGASGSGKSSLVTAGLLPALHGGFSLRIGSHWRVATFRPGGNPIHNLARALTAPDVLGTADADPMIAAAEVEATLRRSSLGLVDAARRGQLGESRLLVVVDQFEEVFRFQAADGHEDAAGFVQLLLEASRDQTAPVDVILTMRSDFLGDCSQFRDLPETINQGLYLVPRLRRSQLSEAITAPAAVGGGTIAPRLVQRLLNDAGANPDVLPVVQHALMRTWDLWEEEGKAAEPLDMEHYKASGGVADALSRHADEAYDELADDRQRKIAELMFKRLTELGADGREIRRPSPLQEIAAIAAATPEEVTDVIGHFEQQGRSFVMVNADEVVDISHESLIRQWPRLRSWVRQEAESRDVYRRLADAADRWEVGEAALLRGPDLQIATTWWRVNQPNQAWADRYNPAFDQAAAYLSRGRGATKRRRLGAAAAVVTLAMFAVVSVLLALRAENEKDRAETATAEAQGQQRTAVGRQMAALSGSYGTQERVRSMLTAVEALRATEADGMRLPVAEEALRSSVRDPLSFKLPGRPEQLGHQEPINTVAFSPDGSMLATAGDDKTALLWDLADLDADPSVLSGHEDFVNVLAFSPDGSMLATAGDDKTALLWDLADLNADPRVLEGHEAGITVIAFGPDGRWLATASRDSTARLWSLDDPVLASRSLDGHDGFVTTLDFSPDGSRLVTGASDGLAMVWEVDNPTADPVILPGRSGGVTTVAFSPDQRWVAAGSVDSTVRLWALSDAAAAPLVLQHRNPVNTLAFSPDGRWLATGSGDATVRLWDLQDPAGPASDPQILRHEDVVEKVAFSTSGRWLATSSRDSTIRLWQVDDPAADPVLLAGHEKQVTTLDFRADERWLATGSDDGSARLWDLEDLSTRPDVLRHVPGPARAEVTTVAFSHDGRLLATGAEDKTVLLWNLDSVDSVPIPLRHEVVLGFEEAGITTVAFSPDGRWLATGSGDQRVLLWDLADTGTDPIPLIHDAGVVGLAFSHDGGWLASAVKDEVALLWDMDDLATGPRRLEGHTDEVTSVAFSPEGQWLATGSRDETVRLFSLDDVTSDPLLLVHEDHVTSVVFSPDGRTMATGSRDGTVRLWKINVADPVVEHRLTLGLPVTSLAYSPEGSQLVVAAADTVQVWDLGVPDPADPVANPAILRDHSGSVEAVAFSPDGSLFASASNDGTARVWRLLDDLVGVACRNAGRNLTQVEWRVILPGEPYSKTCEQWPEGS